MVDKLEWFVESERGVIIQGNDGTGEGIREERE